MNILFIGDVVGKPGREAVKRYLPELEEQYGLDFVIANLENASHGKGLLRAHFLEMLSCGVDVVTLGNHYYAKKEIREYIDDYDNLLRPANLHPSTIGHGSDCFPCGKLTVRVTNLMGRVFMADTVENPFDALETILKEDRSDIHIVDFHAEATGEKQALGFAFDGRISALIGTHTHVQTNDLRLLPKGTLYLSDAGMCGPYNGILGASRAEVIARTWTGVPSVFGVEEDDQTIFSAVLMTFDDETGKIVDYRCINEICCREEERDG